MSEVKGVLLCGGMGTRLTPLTLAMNKHLLRVGHMPMLEHPLLKMVEAGIKDIHVIIGGEHYAPITRYLGSGRRWNIRITYSIQDEAGGIAQAVGLAESFVGNNKMLVVLGDNIFDMSLKSHVADFEGSTKDKEAVLFTRLSDHPERFGVLKFDEDENPTDVIEKPQQLVSNWILTGIYMFTPDVFDMIKTLKPSGRNELEITDVNRLYIKFGKATIIKMTGSWSDCGTFESLITAEEQLRGGNIDVRKIETEARSYGKD